MIHFGALAKLKHPRLGHRAGTKACSEQLSRHRRDGVAVAAEPNQALNQGAVVAFFRPRRRPNGEGNRLDDVPARSQFRRRVFQGSGPSREQPQTVSHARIGKTGRHRRETQWTIMEDIMNRETERESADVGFVRVMRNPGHVTDSKTANSRGGVQSKSQWRDANRRAVSRGHFSFSSDERPVRAEVQFPNRFRGGRAGATDSVAAVPVYERLGDELGVHASARSDGLQRREGQLCVVGNTAKALERVIFWGTTVFELKPQSIAERATVETSIQT